METRIILIVGSILLSCACLGLLVVRLSNPFLKGLGWLGGSFASGAIGAGLLAWQYDGSPALILSTANTLILLGYVLLHVCILELFANKARLPRLGLTLLALQLVLLAILQHFFALQPYSIALLALLVTVQALQTAALLKTNSRSGLRAPVWLSVIILLAFAAFNVFRSIVLIIVGVPKDPNAPNPFQVASVIVYLSSGLGIGFAIFWMTSSQIRLMLEEMANTDPLTGIFNRRSFITSCENELLRSARTQDPFSLIMIDVDHFKKINDLHGHPTGDAVLCALVVKLRDSVRNIDVVGRWGGEEFVALLPGAGLEAAQLVAHRLRHKVEALAIQKPPSRAPSSVSSNATVTVTISLGIATYLGPPDTIAELFRRCDRAMYQAKEQGRNRVV